MNYICANCGALRRAPVVYFSIRKQTKEEALEEAKASSRWPKHCGQPMQSITDVEAQGATGLPQEERAKWISKGMYIVRERQHGKHKWKPVTSAWHIEEAKRQKTAYLIKIEERDNLWRYRIPAKVRKSRRIALGAEET